MKKIIFSLCMAAVAGTNIHAQFVVDSLGRIGIGTDAPESLISLGAKGDEEIALYLNTDVNQTGVFVKNFSDSHSGIFGCQFVAKNAISAGVGVMSSAIGGGNNGTEQQAIGLIGLARNAYTSIGVLGAKHLGVYSPTNFVGVYGAETFDLFPSFYNYSGTYAGFFNGKVRVTNGIYATVLSPTTTAASSVQSGASILSNESESVTDKLNKVSTVQFLRYNPAEEVQTAKKAARVNLADIDIDNLSPKELESLAKEIGSEEPEQYLSPIQYGLAADQLKAVYPELVYEDDNGNVSINYVEMIPLLVQSINELSRELAELKGTSVRKAKAKVQATAIEETASDMDMVRMDQNKPNPFSESTVIMLNIPEKTQKASIFIYDMSGKQVQSLPVTERGETDITLYARDLTAGMYIYTLVVDGKVCVTRKMIVSE